MFEYLAGIFTSDFGTFELVAICLYVGIVVACVLALRQRRTMGDFVRALLSGGATSPETARTLEQAGYAHDRAIRSGLRGKGIFAGTVYEANETVVPDEKGMPLPVYREDFDEKTARFYIPEALKYRAQVRFEKKGTHWMALLAAAVVFFVILVVALVFKTRILAAAQLWLSDAFSGLIN